MTAEDIQDVIGTIGGPTYALVLARNLVVRVGWMPRKGFTGRPPGIYALVGSMTQ